MFNTVQRGSKSVDFRVDLKTEYVCAILHKEEVSLSASIQRKYVQYCTNRKYLCMPKYSVSMYNTVQRGSIPVELNTALVCTILYREAVSLYT